MPTVRCHGIGYRAADFAPPSSYPLSASTSNLPSSPYCTPDAALRNLFENTAAVQFNHRMLAYTTLAGVVSLWSYGRQLPALPPAAKLCLNALAAATAAQVGCLRAGGAQAMVAVAGLRRAEAGN